MGRKNEKLDLIEKNAVNESEDESNRQRKNPEFFIANPDNFFTTRELCCYIKINKYFNECHSKTPEILDSMINIIDGRSKISLRVLDWFVAKYSKKISCSLNKNSEVFDVKSSYKAQLDGYTKRYFDPFRRRKEGKFYYPCNEEGYKLENGESKHILTTLCQLNFFKWAFNNNIISYVEENLDQIITEMNNYNREEKKKKSQIKTENEKNKAQQKLQTHTVKTKDNNAIKLVLTFD